MQYYKKILTLHARISLFQPIWLRDIPPQKINTYVYIYVFCTSLCVQENIIADNNNLQRQHTKAYRMRQNT
jgi:hypothetical protein